METMLFNYRSISDLPLFMCEYIAEVSGVDDVGDLSIEEINEFLNEQEEWYYERNV